MRCHILFIAVALLSLIISCSNDIPETQGDLSLTEIADVSQLKILAVGNSFTVNATEHLPQLISGIGEDNILVARLVRGSCSLEMHWDNHVNNRVDYDLQFSKGGEWVNCPRTTIDETLNAADWDVIVIQQVSGLSGIYASYQPYLNNLIALFHSTNSNPIVAWHTTWSYAQGTGHQDFHRYGNDSERMYNDILDAAEHLPESVDIKIPSAQLIQKLRHIYPEQTYGFTSDGFHLADGLPCYAVSCLWHDLLITPVTGISWTDELYVPKDLSLYEVLPISEIIKDCINENKNQ